MSIPKFGIDRLLSTANLAIDIDRVSLHDPMKRGLKETINLDGLKNDASRIRGEISEKTTRLTEIMNELRGPEATADAIESFLNSLPPPPSDDTSDDTSDD